MKKCNYCGKEHDGFYGSGRFCCSACAHKYANENPITIERLESGDYYCSSVNKVHIWLVKNGYKENKCEICGITEWLGKPILFELHHIDGDRNNNKLSNLKILCPNCHAQTDNYKSKKIVFLKNKNKLD